MKKLLQSQAPTNSKPCKFAYQSLLTVVTAILAAILWLAFNPLESPQQLYILTVLVGTLILSTIGCIFALKGYLASIKQSLEISNAYSKLLTDILQSAPDAMLLINREGLIVSANDQSTQLLGYSKQELIDMPVEHLMPIELREAHIGMRQSLFSQPKHRRLQGDKDFIILTKSGDRLSVDIGINFSQHEGTTYAITMLRDISQRRATEKELKASRAMFTKAERIANIGSWDWEVESNNLVWSEEVYRIFAVSPDKFKTNYENYIALIHPEDREFVESSLNATVVFNQPFNIEHRIIRPDGEERIVRQQGDLFIDKGEHIGHVVGTIIDITERTIAQRELEIADNVFSHISEAIAVTDADNCILRVNTAFTTITGYDAKECIGLNPRELLKSGEHDQAFYEVFWKTLLDEGYWEGELIDRRKDGSIFPSWHRITCARNEKGEPMQYICIFSDITEEKKVREQLKSLAQYDQLTTLPNRTLFIDRLEHAITRSNRSKKHIALMFIDLDGFKGVNDTYGHQTGDQLLVTVAQRLSSSIRAQDTVARLGGDEFTIILEDISDIKDTIVVAQKLLTELSTPIELSGETVNISGSIGISIYPKDGENGEELIKHADMAMYQAKQQGRGRYIFYTDDIAKIAQYRFHLESKLRRAIEEQRLEIYYQPQVDWKTDTLMGAEALVRWNDPEKGLISPADFIPLAEETGLIEPLGNWVLENACIQAKKWQRMGHSAIKMSVNVAGYQITQNSIVDATKRALKESGLDPKYLELEITEGFVMNHPEQGISTLNALRDLGVSLAIDDFGTGYSSLSYLKQLSVDHIKIDRSFIMDIPHDKNDVSITLAIIAMAHNLDLSVIAEGVETTEHIEFLNQHGCHMMQGYYFSPPLPKSEFELLFNVHHWRVKTSASA